MMYDIEQVRAQFPALARQQNGRSVAYFDGPAGSQVPQVVIDAVSRYLAHSNANCGAAHSTSRETDAMLAEARRAAADFLNVSVPDEIVFGPNMTTITLSLSRALGKTWNVGDEIVVSRLDHDANVSPWLMAAREAGVVVKFLDVDPSDCTLKVEQLESLLTNRTKLVAVGAASNATGTVNPISEISRLAHSVGALMFVDAVHLAPHRLPDVQDFACDFLVCSAYKFFGPHVGVMWARSELLLDLLPDKLRPSTNVPPGKWMTGTQNHEGISGMIAAIDYLSRLAGDDLALPRRQRLHNSYKLILEHEQALGRQLIDGLLQLPALKIWGITESEKMSQRVPTVSVTHSSLRPQFLAEELAKRGQYTWAGNHYALPFTESMGLEPHGTLRIGLLHYNTAAEVECLLADLHQIC